MFNKVIKLSFIVILAITMLVACTNGLVLEKPKLSVSDAVIDRDVTDTITGKPSKPDYDTENKDGKNIFMINISDFEVPENCLKYDFSAAHIASIVTPSGTTENISSTFSISLDGLTDDRGAEKASITLTAVYTKQNGDDDFAKVTFDNTENSTITIDKSRSGAKIPVKVALKNNGKPQNGYITIALKYSYAIYNEAENFKEIKLYTFSFDPSQGGAGKPQYMLLNIAQRADSKLEFKPDTATNDWIATLTDSEDTHDKPYTAQFEAQFLGVPEGKKLKAVSVSVTDGVIVETVGYDTDKVLFNIVYKNPAKLFDYVVDSTTIRFEPEDPADSDYYGNMPVEKKIKVIRKLALKFYTPSLSVSKVENGIKQDSKGYFTEITIPPQDTESGASLTYDIYRRDDQNPFFVKIDSIQSFANMQVVYKDYNALICRTAEQEYQIVISIDGGLSKPSQTVKGSRQLTNEEFFISVAETIRHAMIEKSGHVLGAGINLTKEIHGQQGGSIVHSRDYWAGYISYSHKYELKNYKQFFAELSGSFHYIADGGSLDSFDTKYTSLPANNAPFSGQVEVKTPFGDGTVQFNNVDITLKDGWKTRNDAAIASGNISVIYNGQTRSYDSEYIHFPLFMDSEKFVVNLNNSTGQYVQRNGGSITSGAIVWPSIENLRIPETGCVADISGTSASISINDAEYNSTQITFDVKLEGLISGSNVDIVTDKTNETLITKVTLDTNLLSAENSKSTVTIDLNTSTHNDSQSGAVKIKFTYPSQYSSNNIKEMTIYIDNSRTGIIAYSRIESTDNKASVNGQTVTLTDTVFSQSAQVASVKMKLYLVGVAASKRVTMKVISKKNVNIENIIPNTTNPNEIDFELSFNAATTPTDVNGSFTYNIVPVSGAEGFYGEMLQNMTISTNRIVVKPTKTVVATVTASEGTLSGSGSSYTLTYVDANRTVEPHADKEFKITIGLTNLDSQPVSINGATTHTDVIFDKTSLDASANSAAATVRIARRENALNETTETVTINVSEYNPFVYKSDSVKTITIQIVRKAPPLESFEFIKAIKNKTFIDNGSRDKLKLYRYVTSSDGNTITRRYVTWQPGSYEDYPITDVETYTFYDAESVSSTTATYESKDGTKVTFSVTGTELTLVGGATGNSANSDNGPTYIEMVADNPVFISSDGKHRYEILDSGGKLKYNEKTYNSERSDDNIRRYVYNYPGVFWYFYGVEISADGMKLKMTNSSSKEIIQWNTLNNWVSTRQVK